MWERLYLYELSQTPLSIYSSSPYRTHALILKKPLTYMLGVACQLFCLYLGPPTGEPGGEKAHRWERFIIKHPVDFNNDHVR